MSFSSIGTDLHWQYPFTAAGAGTYASVGLLTEASAPDVTKEVMKDRALNQGNRWTPKLAGFVDAGKISAKLEFEKALNVKLLACAIDSLSYYFKIYIPDAPALANQSYFTFKAFLTKVGVPLSENGDRVLVDIELDIDGPIVFTPGA